jgi:hypothetical protein
MVAKLGFDDVGILDAAIFNGIVKQGGDGQSQDCYVSQLGVAQYLLVLFSELPRRNRLLVFPQAF